MKSRYTYPAVIEWLEEDEVFDITFPDLQECFTFAEKEEEIFNNAREVLELCVYERECDRITIPESSKVKDIKLNKGQFVIMIEVWMISVRDKFSNKSVKKTLTIPKWLNDLAIEKGLNFSQILQSSIKQHLGIDEYRY